MPTRSKTTRNPRPAPPKRPRRAVETQPAFMLREFLESDEARPVRIISEYLEPLRRFRDQQIQDTVVFFGSARVHSREWAEDRLARAQAGGKRKSAAEELKRWQR